MASSAAGMSRRHVFVAWAGLREANVSEAAGSRRSAQDGVPHITP